MHAQVKVPAVFVTAADGTIKITNAAAQRLTGAPEAALVGRNIAALLHAADLAEAERLQRAREVGEAPPRRVRVDRRVRAKPR